MVGGHRFKALAVSLLANQSADTRGCQASPEADLVQCPLHSLSQRSPADDCPAFLRRRRQQPHDPQCAAL